MSRVFWAENRETGKRWTPRKDYKEFLVMYDSGYLAVVTDYEWEGKVVSPLDPKVWRRVIRDKGV